MRSPSRRSDTVKLMALLTANVARSMRRIFLALLSGNTRLKPSGLILHVGVPPRPTLVPIPVGAVVTQVPVPATVLIETDGDRVIFLIKQYTLSAT
jgi:hypothetical protein